MLIGVPGSGKTTWLREQAMASNAQIISTDKFIDSYATQTGKTYSEVFKNYMPTAIKLMDQCLKNAISNGQDIYWDQTNLTVKSRMVKLNKIPTDYEKIAVVFPTPKPHEHNRRLNNSDRQGKNIPSFVMKNMISSLEYPTVDEGYEEVIVV